MSFRTPRLFDVGRTGVQPQRWATIAAWTGFGCTLPSLGWRLAMLAGVDTGFADAEKFRASTGATLYVLALDAAQIVGGVLCLGLVQRWGERFPRWVPGLGRRQVHRLVPVVAGGVGAATLITLASTLLVQFSGSWFGQTDAWTPSDGMGTWQTVVLAVAYAPLLVWPFALIVALVGYWRRRRPCDEQVRSEPEPRIAAAA